MDRAMQQLAAWKQRLGEAADRLTVSINLSARQLGGPELIQQVSDALADARRWIRAASGSRSPRARW